MEKIQVPKPLSGGLILSYKCNIGCRHCMYACGPKWKDDWISIEKARKVLKILAETIRESETGPEGIDLMSGLHFTGGEPFLNFELLLNVVEIASDLKIPSLFVETNSYWAKSDDKTNEIMEKLLLLKVAGLQGILVSVNPFLIEKVPFERIKMVIKISREIFKPVDPIIGIFRPNVIIYQSQFYNQFLRLGIRKTLSFEEYLTKMGPQGLQMVKLIPMGRAVYGLADLLKWPYYPVSTFFGQSCEYELLRPWHVHVDNYLNYMTGFCGGISLGNFKKISLDNWQIDLEEKPILKALLTDIKELYELAVRDFNYQEDKKGYVSKCHLCLDIRDHIVKRGGDFKEVQPRKFYQHLR